jgi:hypothetical protein
MSNKKVFFGVRKLKKNERRPTEQEALANNMVKYFGKYSIDRNLLNDYLEPKKPKISLTTARNGFIKYKSRIMAMTQKLKHEKDAKEIIKLNKKLNNAKVQIEKYIPILEKYKSQK